MIIIDKNAKREVQVKYPDRTRVLFPNLDDGYISSNDIVVPGINAPISDDGVGVATINDGAEGNAISKLVISIDPVQDLNGQSNPYPQGGGANKLPNALSDTTSSGGLTLKSNGDGTYVLTGSTSESSEQVYFDLVDEYTLQEGDYLHIGNSVTNINVALDLDNSDGENIDYWSFSSTNRIAQISNAKAGQKVGRIRLYAGSNMSNINITIKPMICRSSTAIDFAPYSNICQINGWTQAKIYVQDTYDATADPTAIIDLNGTIYGGTLDVTTGVLTVDRVLIVLDGTQDISVANWRATGTSVAWLYPYSEFNNKLYADGGDVSNTIADRLVTCGYTNMYSGAYDNSIAIVSGSAKNYSLAVRIGDTSLTTESLINAYLSNNPITVVYPIAEPFTVQLTAQELTTLLGQNNIWADCGDVLELSYSANMNLRLQDLLNEKLDKPTIPGTLGQVLTSDGEGGQTWETQE